MAGQSSHSLEPTGLCVDALYSISPDSTERTWGYSDLTDVEIDFGGIPGDSHHGATRKLKPYETPQLAGTEIINDRQLSIVDAQDMLAVAEGLGLSASEITDKTQLTIEKFMAGQLAANLLLTSSGSQSLNSVVEPGSVLVFGGHKKQPIPSIKITEYNPPCSKPMRKLVSSLEDLDIRAPLPYAELCALFKEIAREKRGWVGSVYSAGTLSVGQAVSLYSPHNTST